VVKDREGTADVADCQTERLWTFVGRTVTTLAGGSEAVTAVTCAGAGTRFQRPWRLALDERGRLLVAESGRADVLRRTCAGAAGMEKPSRGIDGGGRVGSRQGAMRDII
jgi:hypothetical protein